MNSHGTNSNDLTTNPKAKSSDAPATDAARAAPAAEDDPDKQAERLEQEIEEIRDNLGGLVSELDHRRHRLNPINLLTEHPVPIAIAGVVLVGAIWGGVLLHNARERERNSLVGRSRRLQSALRRAMDKPDKVAEAEPSVGAKILTAAGTAAAAVIARKLATRLIARAS